MSLWWSVEVRLDGDEVRRYAVEAPTVAEARAIALAQLPEPEFLITRIDGNADDASGYFDDVIASVSRGG